jgi:uncharacterized DUF497 family protein
MFLIDKRQYKSHIPKMTMNTVAGFEWDSGNWQKCQKHGVSIEAIEKLFTRAVAILPDEAHSQSEARFRAIGWTEQGRAVFVVFTLRTRGEETLIRPLSARYMHGKEIKTYEKENPDLQE